jgi:hypothetical protein
VRSQISPPELLLAGALTELLVVAGALDEAGALEAGPLAESEVDGDDGGGEVGGSDVGGSEVGGSDVGGLELVGGLVVGLVGGFFVGDLDGECDELPPDPFVPLGLSDGCPESDGGVGSSDVP